MTIYRIVHLLVAVQRCLTRLHLTTASDPSKLLATAFDPTKLHGDIRALSAELLPCPLCFYLLFTVLSCHRLTSAFVYSINGDSHSVLSILTQFLSNRSQHVMVDGCRSKLVNVVSGEQQESVLGPLLFILYMSGLFSMLENKLIGYADNSTLMAVVPFPGVRVAAAESLIRDHGRVSQWCDLWGMKLNASKTRTIIVSRSCTMNPQSNPINYWRNCTDGI